MALLLRYRGVVADVERLTALLHCLAGRLVNLVKLSLLSTMCPSMVP